MYPAPKSRQHLQLRYWFCLEHVRSYNASWNYFNGLGSEQIETYQKDAMTGHRPTWKIGLQPAHKEQRILEKLAELFAHQKTKESPQSLPSNERDALATLNLRYPVRRNDIKKRYKELARKYHPDVSCNNKSAKELFIRISTAYQYLLNCGYFKS